LKIEEPEGSTRPVRERPARDMDQVVEDLKQL